MIRNIVFDIGNVLTDFRWKEFLQDKGFDGDMIRRIARVSVASPLWNEIDRGVWDQEKLMQEFIKLDPEIEDELRLAFGNINGIVSPRDYAVPWVKELKDRGLGVYYLSNFSDKAYRECADALNFLPFMDGGIMSFREHIVKPDPRIYRLLLERYGLKPEECVFVDDLEANVKAAAAEGFNVILFQTRQQVKDELDLLL